MKKSIQFFVFISAIIFCPFSTGVATETECYLLTAHPHHSYQRREGKVLVLDSKKMEIVERIRVVPNDNIYDLELHPNKKILFVTTSQYIYKVDLPSRKVEPLLLGKAGSFSFGEHNLAFSRKENKLYAANSKFINVISLRSNTIDSQLPVAFNRVNHLLWSLNGETLIAGGKGYDFIELFRKPTAKLKDVFRNKNTYYSTKINLGKDAHFVSMTLHPKDEKVFVLTKSEIIEVDINKNKLGLKLGLPGMASHLAFNSLGTNFFIYYFENFPGFSNPLNNAVMSCDMLGNVITHFLNPDATEERTHNFGNILITKDDKKIIYGDVYTGFSCLDVQSPQSNTPIKFSESAYSITYIGKWHRPTRKFRITQMRGDFRDIEFRFPKDGTGKK